MKLLILIISFALYNVKALQMYNQKPTDLNNIRFDDTQKCFTKKGVVPQLQSYNANYGLSAYNINTFAQQGVTQESFYEQGLVDFDFENNQFFATFRIDYNHNQQSIGSIWAFGSNRTEYVASYVDGQVTCYSGPLTVAIPQQYQLSYVGDVNLGTFTNEIFAVKTPSNITQDTLLISKLDCSVTSIFTDNLGSIDGYSIQNIYNYNLGSVSSAFRLPAECFAKQTPSSLARSHILRKSIKLPSVLNQ